MDFLSKRLWGVVFIVVGVILGLNTLNITNINLFFDGWWTLFIIVPCFIGLFNDKDNKTSNVIGLFVGVALFLAAQNIINFELIIKLIVPFILVSIGVSFLFGDKLKKKVTQKINDVNKDDLDNIIAVFSEQKVVLDNEDFYGSNLDCVFGDIQLDLRNANISREAIIKASSIFGSVDIILPDDVNVILKSTPIFGGVSNKLRNNKDNKKTIYIDAFCLFGGIDIK